MKLNITGKAAILFTRVWGIIAVLFGLFITFIAFHDVLSFQVSKEKILIKSLMLLFALGFIFLGRFFLKTKMTTSSQRR